MKNVLPVNSSIKGPQDIFNKIVKKKEDYFSLNSNLENCFSVLCNFDLIFQFQ